MKPSEIVTRYLCGDCWGPLRVIPDQGDRVVCVRHGEAHRGLAFEDWVKAERIASNWRYVNVRADYIDTDLAIGLGLRTPHKRRTLEEGKRLLGRDGDGIT